MTQKAFILLATIFIGLGAATQSVAGAMPPARPHADLSALKAQPVFFERFFEKKAAPAPAPKLYEIQDNASFEKLTRIKRIKPYDIPALELDVRVPAKWAFDELNQSAAIDMEKSIPESVARVRSEMISVHQAEMNIAILPLKTDISAKNWLRHFSLASGYSVQGEITEVTPLRATVYYTSIENQKNMFSYASAMINGGFIVFVRCSLPLELKSYMAYVQKQVVDGVEPSNPLSTPVEEQKPYWLINALKFAHPVSWTVLGADLHDITRPSVELQVKGPSDSIDGFIRILAVRRQPETTLMREIETLKTHISDYLGINILSLISSEKPADIHSHFPFARYEVYKAAYKKENHIDPEVSLAVLGNADWYILVYMISPREQDNLLVWARNARTMSLLLKSMR